MADTLVQLLRERAERAPEGLAFGYFTDGERDLRTLEYAELESEARRVASLVAARLAPGDRALLVFEPGLDFIAAFFGCLFAGVVAVPVYPPMPPRLDAGFARIERVLHDVRAAALLTSHTLTELAHVIPEGPGFLDTVPWIVTDVRALGDAEAWRDARVPPDAIALVQYTSGSTAEPKGVPLRHEHVLANQRCLDWFLRQPSEGTAVSWLPTYHDMGLVGAVIYPLYRGLPCYLLSPLHFLQRPARWLEIISHVRGTMSVGPNFAYELCTRRVTEEERARLDLSCWQIALNGAEPVRAGSVRRFERTFAPCGLRSGTVMACYGLAEATLFVTGTRRGEGARFLSVDRDELMGGRAVQRETDDSGAIELVSCGRTPPGGEVRIVDPETHAGLQAGRVGEIWFRGPSVGEGYWNRPEESAALFAAALSGEGDSRARYLRTGDLGFALDGELYVTGRLKDVLVIRGRNVHPHDVEDAAQRADPRLRPGAGVAFPVETGNGESIGLVQETTAERPQELERLARLVRDAVLAELQVTLAALYLVPPRSVPKTSSGTLRRRAARDALLAGELPVLHEAGAVSFRSEVTRTG